MARGDHIRVRRFGYWHHGIDCGDGTLIHYSGELWDRELAAVQRTDICSFAKGGKVEVISCPDDALDADETLRRAESRLGESRYHFVTNNCEHFARWCQTGQAQSHQVQRTVKALGAFCVSAGVVVATVLLRQMANRGRTA